MSHSLADLINVARAVPIEAEASRRGVHLKGRVDRAGPCPRCGGRDRFAINLKKQVWICRGCQRGGDVIDLVRFLDDLDFKQAVELLAGDEAEQNKPRRRYAPPPDEAKRKADMAAWLWSRREPVSKSNPAGVYLRKCRYEGAFPPTLGYSRRTAIARR